MTPEAFSSWTPTRRGATIVVFLLWIAGVVASALPLAHLSAYEPWWLLVALNLLAIRANMAVLSFGKGINLSNETIVLALVTVLFGVVPGVALAAGLQLLELRHRRLSPVAVLGNCATYITLALAAAAVAWLLAPDSTPASLALAVGVVLFLEWGSFLVVGLARLIVGEHTWLSRHFGFFVAQLPATLATAMLVGLALVAYRSLGGIGVIAVLTAFVCADYSTSRLHAVEGELRHERDRARQYLEIAEVILLVCDRGGRITQINRKGCAVTGMPEEELVGRLWAHLGGEADRPRLQARLELALRGEAGSEAFETMVHGALGPRMISWTLAPILEDGDEPVGVLISGEDVTQRRAAEAQIRRMAFHDPLTGLMNRRELNERLDALLDRGQPLAVLFCDLDGFKGVNDTLGHDTGDEVLKIVARRFTRVLREGDLLARLGGDEFIAVLTELPEDPGAARTLIDAVSARLEASVADPLYFGGHRARLGVSVGAALWPDDGGGERDELLRAADRAMYEVKRSRATARTA